MEKACSPSRTKRACGGAGIGAQHWAGLWPLGFHPPRMRSPATPANRLQLPLRRVEWHAGKLWIVSTRLRACGLIPIRGSRNCCCAGSGLQNRAGLHKYDAATGRLLQTGDLVDGSADPHGLLMRDGVLYSCDAGGCQVRRCTQARRAVASSVSSSFRPSASARGGACSPRDRCYR